MKILQINTVYKNGGSTGRIVYDLSEMIKANNIDSYVAYGYEYTETNDDNTFCMESIPALKLSILKTRCFGRHAFYNKKETRNLLKWIDTIEPNLIHLHNLHNHYLNIEILFKYIKEKGIPVIWTLHDCWAFTGWCAYFDMVGCYKWKSGCYDCPNKHSYPKTWFFDQSSKNYEDKKRIFNGVNNLTIVTPSYWLADLVKNSFLKSYPVNTIHNGIDLSNFRCKAQDLNKKDFINILGVADKWGKRKGLDFFYYLRKELPSKFIIKLIGLSQKQIRELPDGIIGIKRTDTLSELVQYYQEADVFVNPTLEDNFPTTNIEALACGTPVVTFKTGGSAECLNKEVGISVERGNREKLKNAVIRLAESRVSPISCHNHVVEFYNKFDRYQDYIELYKKVLGVQ